MRTHLGQWGNSLAIRIPAGYARDLDLKRDAPVELGIEDGCLVLRPAPAEAPTLEALLEAVTDASLHEETRWGPAHGAETW